MKYSELIDAISVDAGISKKDAEKLIKSFMKVVRASLIKDEPVKMSGFGVFDVRRRKARVAKDPRTGGNLYVSEAKVPRFRTSLAFTRQLNEVDVSCKEE